MAGPTVSVASIHAVFDFAEIGSFAPIFTDSGGAATITYTDGKNTHYPISSVLATVNDFALRLQTTLNANATLAGTYTVTFSATTCKYTIAANQTFAIDIDPSGVSGRVLGFTSDKSGAATYTSDVVPYYSRLLTVPGVSNVSDEYEAAGHSEDAYTANGDHYGVTFGTFPKFYDFTVTMEPLAAVHDYAAVSSAPWTLKHFWQHVRNRQSFLLVVPPNVGTVHRLRADAARFTPQRVVADYNDLWNLQFQTVLRGRL